MKKLGADFMQELNSRILYSRIDTVPSSNEKSLILKLNFNSVNEFKNFVSSGGEWVGSQNERTWCTQQVSTQDYSAQGVKPEVISATYKDSVYNELPVVVIIIRYKIPQELP